MLRNIVDKSAQTLVLSITGAALIEKVEVLEEEGQVVIYFKNSPNVRCMRIKSTRLVDFVYLVSKPSHVDVDLSLCEEVD